MRHAARSENPRGTNGIAIRLVALAYGRTRDARHTYRPLSRDEVVVRSLNRLCYIDFCSQTAADNATVARLTLCDGFSRGTRRGPHGPSRVFWGPSGRWWQQTWVRF